MASICLDDGDDDDGGISLFFFFSWTTRLCNGGRVCMWKKRRVCCFPMDGVKGVGRRREGSCACGPRRESKAVRKPRPPLPLAWLIKFHSSKNRRVKRPVAAAAAWECLAKKRSKMLSLSPRFFFLSPSQKKKKKKLAWWQSSGCLFLIRKQDDAKRSSGSLKIYFSFTRSWHTLSFYFPFIYFLVCW